MDYGTFSPQTVTSNNNNQASYLRYWGKARPTNEHGAEYHLLPYHCLDVAAVGKGDSDRPQIVWHLTYSSDHGGGFAKRQTMKKP